MSLAFLRLRPPSRPRYRPAVEGLEDRVTPVVTVVAPPQQFINENAALPYTGGGSPTTGFVVTDSTSGCVNYYEATLSATNGTITLDLAQVPGDVTVSGNGTDLVSLDGPPFSGSLLSYFQGGGQLYTFTPNAFFSGDAGVSLEFRDTLLGEEDVDTNPVGVIPVAQTPTVVVGDADGLVDTPIPFPIDVQPTDPDGSELPLFATITGFPSGTTFSAGAETFPGSGVWRVFPSDFAGLTLTIPAGQAGSYSLTVEGTVEDQATITVGGTPSAFDDTAVGSQVAFVTASLPPPDLSAPTGATIPEGGSFLLTGVAVSDPVPGLTDFYAVTYQFPSGRTAVRPAVDVNEFGLRTLGVGTNQLTISGPLEDIQSYVANFGVVITPDRFFNGDMTGAVRFATPDGREAPLTQFNLRVTPRAEVPVLSLPATVAGPPGGTVPLPILLGRPADPAPVVVVVSGLPAGASLSDGVVQGDGSVRFAGDDLFALPFLSLTLPGGPLQTFALTATATAADTANFPVSGGSLTATESTARSTTVRTLANVTPPSLNFLGEGSDMPENAVGRPSSLIFNAGSGNNFALSGGPAAGTYTVTFRVDRGALSVAPGPGIVIAQPNPQMLTLSGGRDAVNALLAASGLAFVPPESYSGPVRLAADVLAPDGSTGGTGLDIRVFPEADEVCGFLPPVLIASVDGDIDPLGVRVGVPVSFEETTDTDGSEQQFVEFTGVPFGMVFSAGQGFSGTWRVARADLPGLNIFYDDVPNDVLLTVRFVNEDVANGILFDEGGEFPAVDREEQVRSTRVVVFDEFDTPTLIGPPLVTTAEDTAFAFNGAAGTAFVLTPPTGDPTADGEVIFTVPSGTLSVGPGAGPLVTVTGNGTGTLTLSAMQLGFIADLLAGPGIVFTPAAGFAGEVQIDARVNAFPFGEGFTSNFGYSIVAVLPDPVTPGLTGGGFGISPTAPFPVPPGTFTFTPPPPPVTGTVRYEVVFDFTGSGVDPTAFGLTAFGNEVFRFGPNNELTVFTTLESDVQLILDNLAILPPAGFRGTVGLRATVRAVREVELDSQCLIVNAVASASASTQVRFFAGGQTIIINPTAAPEGTPIDLVGVVTLVDPDGDSEDEYTVTLSVTRGTLAVIGSPPPGVSVLNDGPSVLILSGDDLAAIQSLLNAPGRVRFTPDDPFFAGFVGLSVTFVNEEFAAGTEVSAIDRLALLPVAQPLVPQVMDVTTPEDTPVGLSIILPPLLDADGSEEVRFIQIRGVPAEGSLSAGVRLTDPMTGDSFYQLTPAELVGLTFTPPAGLTGTFALRVRTIVRDEFDPADPFGPTGQPQMLAPLPADFPPDEVMSADAQLDVVVTPVFTPISVEPVAGSVPENSPTGTAVGRVFAAGGRIGETFTFQLGTPAAPLDFTVDPDGTVRVGTQNPDFESLNGFDLPLVAVGSRGSRFAFTFRVSILNVNEAPVLTDAGGVRTTRVPLILSGLSVSDPDAFDQPIRVSLTLTSDTPGAVGILDTFPSSIVQQDGTGLALTGTVAEINAVLFNLITYRPAPGFVGTARIRVIASDQGNTGLGGIQSDELTLEIRVPGPPVAGVLTAADVSGSEDAVVPLTLTAGPSPEGATTELFLIGVPDGFTVRGAVDANDGVNFGPGVWRITTANLSEVALLPPADFAGRVGLVFQRVDTYTTLNADGTSSSFLFRAEAAFAVTIAPVAGVPVLTAAPAVGDQGAAVPLTLTAVRGDPTDADETLDLFVLGVPDGFALSAGVNLGNGVWQLSAADLAGLTLVPPAGFAGSLTLTFRAVQTDATSDPPQSDVQTASVDVPVEVRGRSTPPTVTVVDASGLEGDRIPLTLSVTPVTDGGATVVRLVGLPADFTLSAGTFDPSTGDWILSPDQLAGLTVFAPRDTGDQPLALTLVAVQDGLTSSQPFALSVLNVTPMPTGLRDTVGIAGEPVVINLGQFTDPGRDAPWTVTVDFGDGTSVTFQVDAPGALGTIPHTYTQAGTFTITISVFDGTDTGRISAQVRADQPVTGPNDNPPPDMMPVQVEPLAAPPFGFATPFLDVRQTFTPTTSQLPQAPTPTPAAVAEGGFGGVSETPPVADQPGLGLRSPAEPLPTSSRSVATGVASPFSRSAAEAAAFGAGREKHPLPPVLPLDPGSPAGAFGDSGGDSLSLVERLYAAPRPAPSGGGGGDQESDDPAPEETAPIDTSAGVPAYDDGEPIAADPQPAPPADPRPIPLSVWVGLAVAGAAAAGLSTRRGPGGTAPPARLTLNSLRTDEDQP